MPDKLPGLTESVVFFSMTLSHAEIRAHVGLAFDMQYCVFDPSGNTEIVNRDVSGVKKGEIMLSDMDQKVEQCV